MTTLRQQNRFRKFTFSIKDDGVLAQQQSFLRFDANERFYSFYDLGIDLVKRSNNEGLPTVLIVGVMSILSTYVTIVNFSQKLSLALVFIAITLFFVMVIIYNIQKYISATYELTGGDHTIAFLRYKKSNEQTLQFIEKLKIEIKKALVKKYNDLTTHLKPNDHFQFDPLPAGIILSDNDFRLLKHKVNLLYNNITFEASDDLEEENED